MSNTVSPLAPIVTEDMRERHYAELAFLATASSHGLNDDRTVAAFNVWAETVPA